MGIFKWEPNEESQEQLDKLMDMVRVQRNLRLFNSSEYVDTLATDWGDEYLEKTYILDKDRWN